MSQTIKLNKVMVKISSNKKNEYPKQVFKTVEEAVEYKRQELYKIVPLEKLKEILLKR